MLNKIFNILNSEYLPQGWWPIYSKANTKGFDSRGYHKAKYDFPKTKEQRWEIILGAILTQNTSWTNVEKSLDNLKKHNALNNLQNIPENEIAQLIKSSGYFNQKAKKIKAMIEFVDSKKEITRQNLLEIWGIGEETADSILIYAYKKPFFVIDTYTKRIFSRIGLKAKSYREFQDFFHKNLKQDHKLYNEFHALIVEHAKRFCKKTPECGNCCLRKQCSYSKSFGKTL